MDQSESADTSDSDNYGYEPLGEDRDELFRAVGKKYSNDSSESNDTLSPPPPEEVWFTLEIQDRKEDIPYQFHAFG